jgi:hypothetical protein
MATEPGVKKSETATPRAPTVQFTISTQDDADLERLVGDLMTRSSVARLLFLHGLNNSGAAFAGYAKPHQEVRQKRLESESADAGLGQGSAEDRRE